ncbi:MAG: hypothetical protein BWK76_18555 [Desulfobulbaceae bacterium A2]|nr:MAG: hypothetical protein BWK76_18555 [Desulfobulbaceae bacterium A2]
MSEYPRPGSGRRACPALSPWRLPALLLILLLLLLTPAWSAAEEPANGCHCFRDRAFDPAHTFLVDPYLQATVMNSLLASRYAIAKREIVMARMQDGAPADDLLLALHLGEFAPEGWGQLLSDRRQGVPWLELAARVAETTRADSPTAAGPLALQLMAGFPPSAVARLVVDDLLRHHFPSVAARLPQFRAQGLQERELAVLLLLAREGSGNIEELIDLYLRQGKSLSQLADLQGLSPANMGKRGLGE